MFTKVYHLEFDSSAEAKVAVYQIAEEIGGRFDDLDCSNMNINLSQDGAVNITVVFSTRRAMDNFDREERDFIENLKQSFWCRMEEYSAVSLFNMERDTPARAM